MASGDGTGPLRDYLPIVIGTVIAVIVLAVLGFSWSFISTKFFPDDPGTADWIFRLIAVSIVIALICTITATVIYHINSQKWKRRNNNLLGANAALRTSNRTLENDVSLLQHELETYRSTAQGTLTE